MSWKLWVPQRSLMIWVKQAEPSLQHLFRMKQFPKSILLVTLLAVLVCAASGENILPRTFAGWTQTGEVRTTSQPRQSDPADSAVLNEYGFAQSETATYT